MNARPVGRALAARPVAAFAVYLVADMAAIAPMYGDLSVHLATLEAGAIAHLLEVEAPARGIGLCQIGHVDFERIRPLLDLSPSHVPLHSLLGGAVEPDESPAAAGSADAGAEKLARLRARVAALSPEDARALLDARRQGGSDPGGAP